MLKNKIKNQKEDVIQFNPHKVELYLDFLIDYSVRVFTYYHDDGSFDENDEKQFLIWCYDKTCESFFDESIDFSGNGALMDYLSTIINDKYFKPIGKVWTLETFIEYYLLVLKDERYVVDPISISLYKLFDDFFSKKKNE